MERRMRNNKWLMLALLLISLVSSWLLVNYLVGVVSETADREGLDHISENTEQLRFSLMNRIDETWTIMEIEGLSLSEWRASERSAVQDLIADELTKLLEKSGADKTYIISKDGFFLAANGTRGRWQLDEEMLPVLRGESNLVRRRQDETDGGADYLDFAIPLPTPVTDEGYCVLLMEYRLDTFLEVLKLSTYGGRGVAFVVDEKGRTLFRSVGQLAETRKLSLMFYSVFEGSRFRGNPDITDTESLKAVVNAGKSGAVYAEGSNNGRDYAYAVSFRPLGIMDWHLFLTVEESAISGDRIAYIEQVRWIAFGANVFIMILCLGFYEINTRWQDRRAGVQLSGRERIINTLSDNAQGVYVLVNAVTWNCSFVSQSAEEMLDIRPEELTGNPVAKLVHALGCPELVAALRGWDEKSVFEYERFALAAGKNKTERVLRVRAYPPQAGDTLFVILDETADARRESALEDAMHMAHSASMAKSAFLSNMSHDIRTPMNAILGFTTLALGDVKNTDKVEDYLGKILSSGNHLLGLINDVLDMSRIESGKLRLEEEPVNLPAMMEEIQTIIGEEARKKQLSFGMDVRGIADGNVLCDKTRLNRVLMNLLSNAVKFTPAGGTVTVTVRETGSVPGEIGTYEFRVKDTGIGMSAAFAEKIFEPFERERSSTVSRIEGTGLGMAIAKNIVDMMGGTISLTTEQGKGTEFVISLALHLADAEAPAARTLPAAETEEAAEANDFTGKRVLLVEDNELNREIALEILSGCGIEADSAEDGSVAVELAAKERYDLILMDIQMPVMDGYEATRRIRAFGDPEKASVPIVAMTANAFDEDRKAAADSGMNGFVSKPIDMNELFAALKDALA
ncbi:MAG: response regulator [Clostridia bacterium]|nr:response regulator [Clostridia bacterium]